MPTIRKIRTVVTNQDTPATEYLVVTIAEPTKRKSKRDKVPLKKMGIQPIKYFYKTNSKECINTTDTKLNEQEFGKYFSEKYEISQDEFDVSRMYRADGYNLYLVLVMDFNTSIDGFNSRVSWELFDFSENPEQDVFQSVIEKHKKVGIDFKKNTWKNTNDTTKMKPLKLWKTLTGYSFN